MFLYIYNIYNIHALKKNVTKKNINERKEDNNKNKCVIFIRNKNKSVATLVNLI